MEDLKKDFQYYLDHQDELVKTYSGRYLVIKAENVVGDYSSESDAYFDSVRKYGLGNFLIQLCTSGDEAYTQTYHSRVLFTDI